MIPAAASGLHASPGLVVRRCPAAPVANDAGRCDLWYMLYFFFAKSETELSLSSAWGKVLRRKLSALCSQKSWWKNSNSPAFPF